MRTQHVIIQHPTKTPELKGPWPSPMLEESVRELYRLYPDAVVIVMSGTLPPDLYPQHGHEFLDMLDIERCRCKLDKPRNPKCPVDHSRRAKLRHSAGGYQPLPSATPPKPPPVKP